jgi:hypothetical protein
MLPLSEFKIELESPKKISLYSDQHLALADQESEESNGNISLIESDGRPDINVPGHIQRIRFSIRAAQSNQDQVQNNEPPKTQEEIDKEKKEEEDKKKKQEEEEKKKKQDEENKKKEEEEREKHNYDKQVRSTFKGPWSDKPLFTMEDAITNMFQNSSLLKRTELAITVQKGIYERKFAPFDIYINANLSTTLQQDLQDPFNNYRTDIIGHENVGALTISKKNRLGTSFVVTASTDQIIGLLYPIFGPGTPPGFTGYNANNRSSVSFTIFQPLLRDFINSQDTIQEKVDHLSVKSIYYDYLASLEGFLTSTMQKYWDLYAARLHHQERLIAREKLKLIIQRFDELDSKEDWVKNYRKELETKMLSRESLVISTKIDVDNALLELRLAMGMREYGCESILPIEEFSMESFPWFPEDINTVLKNQFDQLYATALENRFELIASEIRLGINKLLLKGASNLSLPRFDVFFSQNWFNFTIGDKSRELLSALNHISSPKPQSNRAIGFSVSIPFFNPDGQGYVKQRKAEIEQALYSMQRREEEIYKDLAFAVSRMENLIIGLKSDDFTIETFRKIAENNMQMRNPGEIATYIGYDERVTDAIVTRIFRVHDIISNIITVQQIAGTITQPYLEN